MTVAGFGVPLLPARAQSAGSLTIVSHKVHQDVTKGPVYDVESDFLANHAGLETRWLTFATPEVQERLMREAVLGRTEVNLGYLLPQWLYPEIVENFIDLAPFEAAKPINRANIFAGMVEAGNLGGRQISLPVRGLVHTLLYNRRILEERGMAVPTTIEEYVDVAKACTYTAGDAKVYGHAANTSVQEIFASFMAFARAFDEADILDANLNVVLYSKANLKALELYKELAVAGTMPPEWPTYSSTDVIREGRQGRVAMITGAPATYYLQFNSDPTVSAEAGNWETVPMPPSADKKGEWTIARHNADFWSVAVPKNGPDPELAWDWIRHMLDDEVQLKMAVNGNGPVSASVYQSPEWRDKAPFADQALEAMAVATPPWRPFQNIAQGIDILGEEIHACLFGNKSADAALTDASERLQRIV
jgi:ABC-type glycerol-3-phosphate transport system substrate-binding protein